MRPVRVLSVTLALLLAACSSDGGTQLTVETTTTSSATTTTGGETTTTSTPERTGGLAPATITLTNEAGSDGTLLRYDLEPGTIEHTTITMTQDVDMGPAGSISQTFAMGMSTVVDDVRGDTVTMTVTIDSVELIDVSIADPAARQQVEAALEQMVGLSYVQKVDTQGRLLSYEIDFPAGLDQAIAQSIDETSSQINTAPFPAEPVTVGSTWTATQTVESAGLVVDTVTTYTLVELDGTRYVMDVSVEQTIDGPQQVLVPRTPALMFEEFRSIGAGRVEGDLRLAVPTASTLETTLHQRITSSGEEIEQTITMSVDLVADG